MRWLRRDDHPNDKKQQRKLVTEARLNGDERELLDSYLGATKGL